MTGKKRRGQQQRHEARNEGVKVIGFQVRSATSAAGTGSTNHLLQYSTRSCWRSYRDEDAAVGNSDLNKVETGFGGEREAAILPLQFCPPLGVPSDDIEAECGSSLCTVLSHTTENLLFGSSLRASQPFMDCLSDHRSGYTWSRVFYAPILLLYRRPFMEKVDFDQLYLSAMAIGVGANRPEDDTSLVLCISLQTSNMTSADYAVLNETTKRKTAQHVVEAKNSHGTRTFLSIEVKDSHHNDFSEDADELVKDTNPSKKRPDSPRKTKPKLGNHGGWYAVNGELSVSRPKKMMQRSAAMKAPTWKSYQETCTSAQVSRAKWLEHGWLPPVISHPMDKDKDSRGQSRTRDARRRGVQAWRPRLSIRVWVGLNDYKPRTTGLDDAKPQRDEEEYAKHM
ncbi:hypothetical protein GQ600_12111 [Phytophthora cactorum]|nr:hypothetical protein GQ600_12111 [Phytophthora cactorum]